MSGAFQPSARPPKAPGNATLAPVGFQPRRAVPPTTAPLATPRSLLTVNCPGDAFEQEADRAADAVLAGGTLPVLHPGATPNIQREERTGPPNPKEEKTEEEKYKEALKKTGEAFLKTETGKRLKKQAEELGKDFVATTEGKVITGVAVSGLLAGLIAANESLPIQPPAIPLDFIHPGLKGNILYEGSMREPTKAGLKLTFGSGLAVTGAYTGSAATDTAPRGHGGSLGLEIPLGRPRDSSSAQPSEAERQRAENARRARELEAFRRSMMTEEERAAEDRIFRNALNRMRGGDPLNPLHFDSSRYTAPGLGEQSDYQLRLPQLGFREPSLSLLPENPFGDLSLRPPLRPPPFFSGQGSELPSPERREEEDTPVQRKARSDVNDTPRSGLRAPPASTGTPLDASTRHHMETRFGVDFSAVRIHADDGAAQAAERLHAHAFTQGGHIYFGAGRFDPRSLEGTRLLAHELAHVVQQGAAGPVGSTVTLEREARLATRDVLRGRRPRLRHRHDGREPFRYDPGETPDAPAAEADAFEPDYLSGGGRYEMLREGRALAAQRGINLTRLARTVVVTQRARVFDGSGNLLGTYDLRSGVRFSSGVLLVAPDGTFQIGTVGGRNRYRRITGGDLEAVEDVDYTDRGYVALESLLNIPAAERGRVWTPGTKLLLVAGRPGSGGSGRGGGGAEGEAGSGGQGGFGTEFSIEDADGRTYQYPPSPPRSGASTSNPSGEPASTECTCAMRRQPATFSGRSPGACFRPTTAGNFGTSPRRPTPLPGSSRFVAEASPRARTVAAAWAPWKEPPKPSSAPLTTSKRAPPRSSETAMKPSAKAGGRTWWPMNSMKPCSPSKSSRATGAISSRPFPEFFPTIGNARSRGTARAPLSCAALR
ncbi:MAG: DUF4157 domain-containing protein [Opitutales bacterium]